MSTVVTPAQARELIDAGATLVDIRGKGEYAREHIKNAVLAPITDIQTSGIDRSFKKGEKVVAYCQIGKRSSTFAADIERAVAPATLFVIDGGLNNWKSAGQDTVVDKKAPLPIMRQVQITAGSLVVSGVVLSQLVNPLFILLSAFVGSGLVFAGVTGWCGMAIALSKLPWNKNASL